MKHKRFNSPPKSETLKLFSLSIIVLVAVAGAAVFMQGIAAAQAWNTTTAVWDGANSNLSVAEQDLIPNGMFFSPEGTKLFITGYESEIYQYTLAEAWNVSSATSDGSEFTVAAQDSLPAGIFFDPTGTKMFVAGRTNAMVYQYTLSTPWQLSTSAWDGPDSNLTVITVDEPSLSGIFFDGEGKKLFVLDYGNDFVYQYSLSTAWDIRTATYLGSSSDIYVGDEEQLGTGLFFNATGTKMFIVGYGGGSLVHQYTLAEAWNTATAAYDGAGLDFNVNSQDSIATGIFFNATGTKMFISGDSNNRIYQYSLSNPICKKITFRSKGYFDNHPAQWAALLPQTLGNETVANTTRVAQIFDRTTKVDRVKAPLLALKFNLKNFPEAASFLVPGENTTMSALAAQADALLQTSATTAQLTLMKDRLESTTITFKSCSAS